MPVLMRLGKKLGLLTTPARDAAKQWAEKTRQYEMGGHKLGDAAIAAARDVFHADFKVTHYMIMETAIPLRNCSPPLNNFDLRTHPGLMLKKYRPGEPLMKTRRGR
jgi:hypothetical protein